MTVRPSRAQVMLTLHTELTASRTEFSEAKEQLKRAHVRLEERERARAEVQWAQLAETERADQAESKLAVDAERLVMLNKLVAAEMEREASASEHASVPAARADAVEARLEAHEHDHEMSEAHACCAHRGLQQQIDRTDLISTQKQEHREIRLAIERLDAPHGDEAIPATPWKSLPISYPRPESAEARQPAEVIRQESKVIEARLEQQLAIARAERAERHALALESRGVRALADMEAVALEEEQKARMADERRVVAERQCRVLEAQLAAESLRSADTIAALEGRLRAASEHMIERRLPQFEAAARKADARSTQAQTAQRARLQKRAEASQLRLGRVAAAHLTKQRIGAKHPQSQRAVGCRPAPPRGLGSPVTPLLPLSQSPSAADFMYS